MRSCKVCSADRKADQDRQVAPLAALAAGDGCGVAKVVAGVGRGRRGHRKGPLAVWRAPDDGSIVVGQRDRLARCGAE